MKFHSGQIANVSNHSVLFWFAMLLWWSSRSYCALLCWCGAAPCCGEALVRFVIHNVAVVLLSLVLYFTMLLWWSSCSFCNSQCCWGAAPVCFVIRNVAVVWILLMFQSGQILNVSKPYVCNKKKTTWYNCECVKHVFVFDSFRIRYVAVVQLLLVLRFATLLWWGSCSFYNVQYCYVRITSASGKTDDWGQATEHRESTYTVRVLENRESEAY